MIRSTTFGLLCCLTLGCTSDRSEQSTEQGPDQVKEREQAHRAKLLEIAAKYKTYAKVDDRMRVAPAYCEAPQMPQPEYRVSRSDNEATHGWKVYALYALKFHPEIRSYVLESKPNDALEPVSGQIVVKESWIAEEVSPEDATRLHPAGPDGKRYKPGKQGPLFVMFQTDPKDPLADDGWVYGTLTPDGKTVTGVGRLDNCMGCHQKVPHGRLFGLPKD